MLVAVRACTKLIAGLQALLQLGLLLWLEAYLSVAAIHLLLRRPAGFQVRTVPWGAYLEVA
jgi:hypothetical protein